MRGAAGRFRSTNAPGRAAHPAGARAGAGAAGTPGALLTAGYASAAAAALAGSPQSSQVTSAVQGELTKSFDGAEDIAHQYPQHA